MDLRAAKGLLARISRWATPSLWSTPPEVPSRPSSALDEAAARKLVEEIMREVPHVTVRVVVDGETEDGICYAVEVGDPSIPVLLTIITTDGWAEVKAALERQARNW